jgi:hypothetical protein
VSSQHAFITIEADTDNFRDLARELRQALDDSVNVYIPFPKHEPGRRSLELLSPEFIIALSSAGAFTGILNCLIGYLARNRDREVTIQRGETKVTIKGHTQSDENTLVAALFPELTQR